MTDTTWDPNTFYLGGEVDAGTGERTGATTGVKPHHLNTHGVILGMTGSGKTGLGVVLLEEALLSGVPALVIDPKGDMGNLALGFPRFRGADFEPWVDPAEARRKGVSVETLAADTAETWRSGLASWGIGPERVARLAEQVPITVYTPGSSAGAGLNIVGSLAAPEGGVDEVVADEIESYVSSLLTLADIPADPLASPEHVLISNLITHAWRQEQDLDLPTLIAQVVQPPIRKLGVFDLDTFVPPAARMKLAMRLNGLVASPSFSAWLQGPALDIQKMLYGGDGRPRCAVVYMSHLSDAERQMVVTLLLSRTASWMRRQSGTSDLRALVYMDEVYGYAPPSASPPSKKPILTLLKQARAFGVGLVLSTQNPVDLDYKAMSNTGTWLIGRLQTERDKMRVLEGLRSAAGGVDVDALDTLIGGLGKRQFVLHSARGGAPTLFGTRWAQSFLAGPLSREQVERLQRSDEAGPTTTSEGTGASPTDPAPAPSGPAGEDDTVPMAPQVADGVPVRHLDPAAAWAAEVGARAGSTRFEAAIAARVHLIFDDARAGVDHDETWEAVFHPLSPDLDAADARPVDYDDRDLRADAPDGARYVLPDAPLDSKRYFSALGTALKNHLHRSREVQVFRNRTLDLYSRVGEDEAAFRARCAAAADERADADTAKLRDTFDARIRKALDRVDRAEARVHELAGAAQARQTQELVSGASTLLSMFMGGRAGSRGLRGAANRRAQTMKAQRRLEAAQSRLTDAADAVEALEADMLLEIDEIGARWDAVADEIEPVDIGLEKSDITIDEVALVWIPVAAPS
jgi:hypothetical protein